MAMTARIWVTLKPGVLDPQGKAIAGALDSLGFSGVEDVRQGKYLEVRLDALDEAQAREGCRAHVRGACWRTP